MHPIFVNAGKSQAVPILFVTTKTFAAVTKSWTNASMCSCVRPGLSPRPAVTWSFPVRTESSRAFCSVSKTPTTP